METTLPSVRLIAFDLDGTLLNTAKELTPRTRAALLAAAEAGIELVPATGRFFRGLPQAVRELPCLRYVISINGASVVDARSGAELYSAKIPPAEALALLERLDALPVIYDCYVDGWGYITASMQARAEDFIDDPYNLWSVRNMRAPAPELKAFLREGGHAPQKVQLYTRDRALRDRLLEELARDWPRFAVTSSLPNNIEINRAEADKGRALLALAERLGLTRAQTMAFGDGLNDLTMLRAAQIGVAMANAHPALLAEADEVADDCDRDGVAKRLEALLEKE